MNPRGTFGSAEALTADQSEGRIPGSLILIGRPVGDMNMLSSADANLQGGDKVIVERNG